MTNHLIQAKIAFVGSSGVGKSSIVARMAMGKQSALPNELTIAAAYAQMESGKYKLLIWDTAGSERFQSFLPMYLRGARVIMAVYDVGDAKSLEYVARERARLVRDDTVSASVPWILVGNKVDISESAHQVSHREAQALADSWRTLHKSGWEQVAGLAPPFCEGPHLRVSAKTTANLDRLLSLLVSTLDSTITTDDVDTDTESVTLASLDVKENSTKTRSKPCC